MIKTYPYIVDEKYSISKTHGEPYSDEWCKKQGWPIGKQHKGVDFVVPEWTAVHTPEGGIVVNAEYTNFGWGLRVGIEFFRDNKKYKFNFAHLIQANVKIAQPVVAGQLVGMSGSTGISSGPHLHAQLNVWTEHGWVAVPIEFIKRGLQNG